MIVDTNVTLSRWPFRRLPGDDTPELVRRLRKAGVTQAWASTFDALLHRDIAGANLRLAEECRRYGPGLLIPFGAVNPVLPDWRDDVRRCVEVHRMPGIRLYPNYHRYALADSAFAEILELAGAKGLLVQIAVSMEDARTQHPLLPVAPVDPGPLERFAAAKVMLLNWWPALRGDNLTKSAKSGRLMFDIATVEGIEGIARLTERVPLEQICFGSHAPFFALESALLKMRESGLPEARQQQIFAGNAQRFNTPGSRP